MKQRTSVLLSAAISGLVLGSTTLTLGGCKSNEAGASQAAVDKHACKGLNVCKNQGGCKTGDQGCKGKNSCAKKGGCATVDHHGCAKQNQCAKQGGCGSGDNGCKAKNSCKQKGGCAVPIKH